MENAREINEEEFYSIIKQKEGDFLDFKYNKVSGSGLQEAKNFLLSVQTANLPIGINQDKKIKNNSIWKK